MTTNRKHVGFFRLLWVLIVSLAVNFGLLYLTDWVLKAQFKSSALQRPYYLVFALGAVLLFLLLIFPANRPLQRFKSFLRWTLIVVLLLAVWLGGSVWNLQNEQIYTTGAYNAASEEAVRQNTALKAVTIPSRAGQNYSGYLWYESAGNSGLILYFGGNGEFAAASTDQLSKTPGAAQLFTGWRVLMVDYPGYGLSEGEPGEENNYRMALAAWDYAQNLSPKPDRVVLMGWSLGTGAAARLADEKEPSGLVLMAPFYNGSSLLAHATGVKLFEGPLSFLVRNKYTSDVYARTTQAPTLIIAGASDKVIPAEQSQELAKLYEKQGTLIVEGGHNEARFSMDAVQAIGGFIQKLKPVPANPQPQPQPQPQPPGQP